MVRKKFIFIEEKHKPVVPDKFVTITANDGDTFLVDGIPMNNWKAICEFSLSRDDLTYLRLGLPVRINV